MKKLPVLLVLLLWSLTGCVHPYVIKLSNGRELTTASKPRLKGANYYYKDARGQEVAIPQSRVIEILPASMAKEEKSRFKSSEK